MKKWSVAFGWQARVAERDKAVIGLVRERATKIEVDRRTRNRRIIEATIVAAAAPSPTVACPPPSRNSTG